MHQYEYHQDFPGGYRWSIFDSGTSPISAAGDISCGQRGSHAYVPTFSPSEPQKDPARATELARLFQAQREVPRRVLSSTLVSIERGSEILGDRRQRLRSR